MPRQLQSKIHSDFSSETYKWEIYQAQAQELFDNSTSKADFNAHLIREYNRKINNLNQPSQLYFQPYDAGFSLTSNVLDGLKLSLDLNFDANTTYSQSTVGSTAFTLASRYGPNASFSRLSPATFRGSNGLIQYAPENLLSYSEQFNDASWSKSNVTVSANSLIAPDGSLTSDKLVETAISNSHILQKSITSISGGVYTLSVYAKASERSWCILQLDSAFTGSPYAYFDLENGVVGNTSGSPSAKIISVGSGWYRCTISAVGSGSSGTINIFVSSGNGVVTYLGDITKGLYIWGAQLERSSTARPYISTTSTPVYGPRLEYDVNGNALGLLIEESSSNLLAYSEQFDNAYWGRFNLNTTGSPVWINAATSPNGTQTAEFIIPNTNSVLHYVEKQLTVSAGVYTASVYAKAGGYNYIAVGESSGPSWAYFNLTTGEIGNISGSAAPSIQNVGNGWYRCSVTFTSAGGNKGWFALCDQSNGSLSGFAGNGTSGIYIWGAQLEQKPFATSYIPTTASGGIARAADTCTLNIDLGNSWFNESEGTIMVEGDRLHSPALNAGLYDSLFIFSAAGSASLGHFGDGTSELFTASDGSNIVTALSVSLPNQPLLFVGSYSASSGEIYVSTNNTVTQSQAGFSSFSTPDTITFGYSAGVGEYLNGHIKSFKYYKKSLDSTIMEALPL